MITMNEPAAYINWDGQAFVWQGLRLEPAFAWREGAELRQSSFTGAKLSGGRLAVKTGPWRIHLDFQERAGWLLVDGVLEGEGSGFSAEELTWKVSGGELAESDLRCWGLPYTTWGRQVAGPAGAETVPWWRSVWHRPGADGVALGWHLPADWLHRVERKGTGLVCSSVFACTPAPGESLRLDRLAVHPRIAPREALTGPESFLVARRRPEEAAFHGGWNTWDYYKLAVDEAAVLEHLAFLRSRPELRRHVRYIIIDDGWQSGTGDWEVSDRFPRGMAALAADIVAAGFVPGIWSAPFFADLESKVGREHPEWFVHKNGKPFSPNAEAGCTPPWGDRYYLDPSHPGVVEHVFQLYQRLRGWGFRYFKTDFLTNPFLDRGSSKDIELAGVLTFHDRGLGLHRAHRRCMQTIRAAIGEDSFWLGCGAIWATGAGLMDAARTSGDICVDWAVAKVVAESVCRAGAMHGTIWLNDPDFLVVRGAATSARLLSPTEGLPAWRAASHGKTPGFSPDEARVWATCVILGGGIATLSDGLTLLNDQGLQLLECACRLTGGVAASPVDIESELSGLLLAERGTGPILAAINWSDAPRPACTPEHAGKLPELVWIDAWSGRRFVPGDLPKTELPPHSCLLGVPAGAFAPTAPNLKNPASRLGIPRTLS